MSNSIDLYAHRLSIKNDICYESALNLLKSSIDKLNERKYESNDVIRSAYKYSRTFLKDQNGGNLIDISKKYNIDYATI